MCKNNYLNTCPVNVNLFWNCVLSAKCGVCKPCTYEDLDTHTHTHINMELSLTVHALFLLI